MRKHLKQWAAIALAFLAGIVVAEIATEWHEPSASEIPLHASVQVPAESSPSLALGAGVGKARPEKE